MSKKPFIIKSKMIQPMIPTTSELYDEVQESRIQIVQAINGYLVVHIRQCRSACFMKASNSCGLFGTTNSRAPATPISPQASLCLILFGRSPRTWGLKVYAPKILGAISLIQEYHTFRLLPGGQLLSAAGHVYRMRDCHEGLLHQIYQRDH